MQLVETLIAEQYGSVPAASKITGQYTTTFYRWIKNGAMVDSHGDVYVKSGKFMGKLKA